MTYVFFAYHGDDLAFVHYTDEFEPLKTLRGLVNAKLLESPSEPGRWATLDGQTRVERREWINLGAFDEDRAGSGVPVVAA